MLIFCQIKGILFDMHINTEMQTVFFEPDADTELVKDAFMPFGELVLVFLLSVTICQLQMLLCLWFKPVYSFYDNVYADACVSVFSECFF